MKKFLFFQLTGPMVSWGEAAPGGDRHSLNIPTKSALLGFMQSCLGIPREQTDNIEKFWSSYNFIVCGSENPVWSSDYHTIQVPRFDKKKQHLTRKAELENDQLETILSQRDFYSDVWYVVAVHALSEAPYKLQDLKTAMECPKFIPYLGRKANPTGLYLKPTIAEGDIKSQFSLYVNECRKDFEKLGLRIPALQRIGYWEGDVEGLTPKRVMKRRDVPVSRKQWLFRERSINCGEVFPEEKM